MAMTGECSYRWAYGSSRLNWQTGVLLEALIDNW